MFIFSPGHLIPLLIILLFFGGIGFGVGMAVRAVRRRRRP